MAQYKNMHPVDLACGSAPVVSLGRAYYGDVKANRVGAYVYENNKTVTLGGTCLGTAILGDGSTVPLTGTIDGNAAYIELDSACYSVEGQISVFVKWMDAISGKETTLIAFVGTVTLTETDAVIQPSTPIPDLPQLLAQIATIQTATAAANAAADSARAAADEAVNLTIYCWGDSLTEGVGGYVMHPDGRNAYMAYSYPAWLGQSYNVVNLGARSENIPAIMARQGADPIVLDRDVSIPASADTPVLVGQVSQIYHASSGLGFTSKSGALVKINKEVESPGLNPCVIAGVEGNLYRELTSGYLNNETTYNYFFRRLQDGTAVTAAAGTEIKTYAMLHCRKGVAIIWMGANGGYSSASDFVSKVRSMVEYGKYFNYLVIISREFSGSNLAAVKAGLTDDDGLCHVISLLDVLPYRGYGMAGIARQGIDTSGWSTTDPVKKYAPLLCEYLAGQTGEDQYGALHYSAWGYKAIAKLVQEKLGTMRLTPNTKQKDEYGTLLYKLSSVRTLTGYDYIDTKVKLFDDVSKDWTFAIRWSGPPTSPDGYPANVFCCTKDGTWKGLLYRYYQAEGANILFGTGVSVVEGNHNMIDNYSGTNVVVIVKDGDSYMAFVNSNNMAYDQALVYHLDPADATNLSLIIGARHSSSGSSIQFKTALTVEDVRIYDSALDGAAAASLYNELAQ